MHEGRADPPDIDLDLCSKRRDEVRDEVIRRHSPSGAAVAATAATLSLRGAVRVAARALGHPPREVNELSRHVPTRFTDRGLAYNPLSGWEEALGEPAMREHPAPRHGEAPPAPGAVRQAQGEGLAAPGTHLGGLVFGNEKNHLSELVPLEPSGKDGLLRTQYDKDDPGVRRGSPSWTCWGCGCTPRCTRPGSWPQGGSAGRSTPTLPRLATGRPTGS